MPVPPRPASNSSNNGPNTMYADSKNASATDPIATVETNHFGDRRPSVRLISAPSSGRRGIHTRLGGHENRGVGWSMLVPERGEAVDVDVAPAAEDCDDDRQAHRRLGGGHGDHDERERVGGQIAPHARERQERDVGGV